MASKQIPRRRVVWLLGALVAVLVVAFTQRSLFVGIPFNQAYRCLRKGNVTGAEWWHSVARKLAPSHPETTFVEARLWRHKQDFVKSRECLARAKELGLSAERILREEWLTNAQDGRVRDAAEHLGELLADARGEEAEICEAFSIGFIKVQNYAIAQSILSNWEKDYPQDPQPHYLRAKLWHDERLWSDARDSLDKALQLDPNHGGANLLMGEVLLADKRPESAIKYFERAEADSANRIAAKLGRARSLIALGNTAEAGRLLRELLSNDPEHLESAVALSQLEISQGEYSAALARLEPLMARKPHDLDLRYAYAMALRGVGRIKEATTEFESFAISRAKLDRAAKLKETLAGKLEDIDTITEIGNLCLQIGLEKEGLLWLNIVLEKDPHHLDANQVLADYYHGKRDQNPRFRDLARRHAELAEAARRSRGPGDSEK